MKLQELPVWRRAWPIVLPFFILGTTPLVVGAFFGKGWRLSAGVSVLVLWFLVRPWRFGLASADERRQVLIGGTIGLAGLILNFVITYYRL